MVTVGTLLNYSAYFVILKWSNNHYVHLPNRANQLTYTVYTCTCSFLRGCVGLALRSPSYLILVKYVTLTTTIEYYMKSCMYVTLIVCYDLLQFLTWWTPILIVSCVGVAVGVVFLVWGCIFWFRCCGKCGGKYSMRQSHDYAMWSCSILLLLCTFGLLWV